MVPSPSPFAPTNSTYQENNYDDHGHHGSNGNYSGYYDDGVLGGRAAAVAMAHGAFGGGGGGGGGGRRGGRHVVRRGGARPRLRVGLGDGPARPHRVFTGGPHGAPPRPAPAPLQAQRPLRQPLARGRRGRRRHAFRRRRGRGITSGGGLDVGDADDACPVTACSRAPLLRLGTDLILLALARCGAGQPSAGVASGLTIAASGVRPELPGTSTVGLGISEATFKFKDEEAAMENENFFQKRQRPRQRLGKEDESLFKDQAHVPAGADAISEAHAWASVVLAKEACRSLDAPEVEASVSQLARLLLEMTLRALRPAMAGRSSR